MIIYYFIGFISIIVTLSAQFYVKKEYNKYKKIDNEKGLSGFDVARKILDKNGLSSIYIVETKGIMSDHYDPKGKVVRLSKEVFNDNSISSVAIAAHECGHAVQHKNGNALLNFRMLIAPVVGVASKFGYIAIFIGFIFGILDFIYLGIGALFLILIFQLATLPIELDASKKGLSFAKDYHFVNKKELDGVKKVLTAAALTYVASLATTVLEILRLFLLAGGRNR